MVDLTAPSNILLVHARARAWYAFRECWFCFKFTVAKGTVSRPTKNKEVVFDYVHNSLYIIHYYHVIKMTNISMFFSVMHFYGSP